MDKIYCDYEVKAFRCCKRPATVEIERSGCFCSQHAKKVLAILRRDGLIRLVEKVNSNPKK